MHNSSNETGLNLSFELLEKGISKANGAEMIMFDAIVGGKIVNQAMLDSYLLPSRFSVPESLSIWIGSSVYTLQQHRERITDVRDFNQSGVDGAYPRLKEYETEYCVRFISVDVVICSIVPCMFTPVTQSLLPLR